MFGTVDLDRQHGENIRLLCIAYALKDHKAFVYASRNILSAWNSTARTRIEHAEEENIPLPQAFWVHISLSSFNRPIVCLYL